MPNRSSPARFVCLIVCGCSLLAAATAQAYTAQQIIDTAVANYAAVDDFTATLDASTEGFSVVASTYQWARDTAYPCKAKWVDAERKLVTDGSGRWNYEEDPVGEDFAGEYWNQQDGASLKSAIESEAAAHLLWPEEVLATHTWTLDPNTCTVNNVECYKLTTTGYVAYIDTATRQTVVRLEQYNDTTLVWRVTSSDFANVEQTAVLPQVIDAASYANGNLDYTITYTFSDITLNDNLPASTFDITVPTAP